MHIYLIKGCFIPLGTLFFSLTKLSFNLFMPASVHLLYGFNNAIYEEYRALEQTDGQMDN